MATLTISVIFISFYVWIDGPTTTRTAGGLDFTATGGKRQGREVPQSLWVEPGAKHPVWKTQLKMRLCIYNLQNLYHFSLKIFYK
jgi:hypothetical protein